MNARRNKDSIVNVVDGGNSFIAKIPSTRSMLGIMGTNGIINGGDYKEDGWVYVDNKPVRKWFATVDRIKIWEPKLNNVVPLYFLYKKAVAASNAAWNNVFNVVRRLWGDHQRGKVKAHAFPVHYVDKEGIKYWEYTITNEYTGELSFSFKWIDNKPKRLLNHKLGQKLYLLEERRDIVNNRARKVKSIFFEAMKKSLPAATENKVISLQFGEDAFLVFYNKS